MARQLRDLVDLERADIEALRRRQRRERANRGWFWRKLEVWTERFEKLGKWAKAAVILVGLASPLWVVASNGIKLVWKVVQIHSARYAVAPGEQPRTDHGIASTTIDRVPQPQTPPPKR